MLRTLPILCSDLGIDLGEFWDGFRFQKQAYGLAKGAVYVSVSEYKAAGLRKKQIWASISEGFGMDFNSILVPEVGLWPSWRCRLRERTRE